LVDFAPAGTERRTSAYLPPEGEEATTPGCDGYALRKIITDFLFLRMSGVWETLLDADARVAGRERDMELSAVRRAARGQAMSEPLGEARKDKQLTAGSFLR
jgi:hypothetical protein